MPPGGLEPPTVGLKVRCSAIELGGQALTSLRDAGGVPQQSDSMAAARKSVGLNPLVPKIPWFGSTRYALGATARRAMFKREGKSGEFDLLSKSLANLMRMWADD